MVSKRHYELRKRQFRVVERRVRPLLIRIMDELQEFRVPAPPGRNVRPRLLLGTNPVPFPNQTATTSTTIVEASSESSMLAPASGSTISSQSAASNSIPSPQTGSSSSAVPLSSRQRRSRKNSSPIERLCIMKAKYYSEMIKFQKEKLQFKREKLEQVLNIENQKIEILRERNRILERYVENKLQVPIGLI